MNTIKFEHSLHDPYGGSDVSFSEIRQKQQWIPTTMTSTAQTDGDTTLKIINKCIPPQERSLSSYLLDEIILEYAHQNCRKETGE